MAPSDVEVLRRAWEAFARGDLAAATDALDPHVRWYGAGDLDGERACHGREAALAFIERALGDGVTAELLGVHVAGDNLVAVVHTHAPQEWEQPLEPHGELVSVRNAKIIEMVVYPTVEDALAAARVGEQS